MIVLIGSCAWDITLTVPRHPRPGDEIKARLQRQAPGGKATNSAAWAASEGTPVRLLTRIGTDDTGTKARTCLRDVPGLDARIQDADSTFTCHVMITPDGQRTIVYYVPGADKVPAPQPAAFTATDQQGAKVTWIDVADVEARETFRARATGLVGLPLQHVTAQTADGNWSFAVGSADDISDEHLAAAQCPGGVDWYLLTRGADRITFWSRQHGERVIAVTPVHENDMVDTCGAGDAFLGGVLAALHDDQTPVRAAQIGSCVAVNAVLQAGAWPASSA